MPCPLRLSLSLAVATLTLAGCGDTVNPGVSVLDAGSHADAGTPMDVVAPVDHGPPTLDSGCPAPQTITPAQVPGGFLAPSNVRFIRDIDGDTAIFSFAVQGETTVRFEWVNTEESHAPNPADNTAFGIATSAIVVRYLSTGGAFVVVRHASPTAPTMPNLDTFGRTLGLVFIDGELFQERLVREGLSAYYTDFGCAPEPIHSALLLAEAEARANHRGIWAPGHPTDYAEVFSRWITGGTRACRPNPFRNQLYCH